MQLIDVDKLFKEFEDHAWENNTGREEAEDILLRFPTVDAEPVRHGKWIETWEDLFPRCSVCGEMSIDATYGNKGMYCSCCGAKMVQQVTGKYANGVKALIYAKTLSPVQVTGK